MIKRVISSASRLPLAPARLAGRMTVSLLRQLRGNSGADAGPASSARANPPSRSRAKARPKRAATGARAKARPKRAATGTRAKARPKRAATGTRAKARPKRAARPKPLDDPAIARKVESTIFGDLDVDKREVNVNVDQGVVTLGGKVGTPDLIQQLEARATRVAEVRRVENRLRVPERPGSARTDMPAPQPKTDRFQRQRPRDHALVAAETSEETAGPADRTEALAAAGQASRDRATGEAMDSASDRAQEATEERAAHEATEERKAREAAERGPAQEAVSDSGAATRAADALTEGGAADTAAKGAPEAAAAPKNVTGKAADAAKGVTGDVTDATKKVSGDVTDATKKVSGDVSGRAEGFDAVDDDETTTEAPTRETP